MGIYVRTSNEQNSYKSIHFVGRMYSCNNLSSSGEVEYPNIEKAPSGSISKMHYREATEKEIKAFELGCINANEIDKYLNLELNYEIC